MVLSDDDLRELIEGVWAPSLELPVVAGAPGDPADLAHGAVLRFSGGWNGHVCIDAADGFARAVAAAMFGLPDADVTTEDARDALGEMANVMGGNVKSYAAGEVDLALPVTGAAGAHPAGTVAATAWCTIGDSPVRVSVLEDAADETAALATDPHL